MTHFAGRKPRFVLQRLQNRRVGRLELRRGTVGLNLVARHHVLGNALQAHDRVRDQRQTPEFVVVLAHVVRGNHGTGALHGGNGIGPTHGGMLAIQVGGLNFHVANALLAGEPVFLRKKCGVGIGKRAAGRDHSEAEELSIDYFRLFDQFRCRSGQRGFHDERFPGRYRTGSFWQFLGCTDSTQYQHGQY